MSNDEISPHVAEQIDIGLRRVYDELVSEEIPQSLKDLVDELSEKTKNQPGADGQ